MFRRSKKKGGKKGEQDGETSPPASPTATSSSSAGDVEMREAGSPPSSPKGKGKKGRAPKAADPADPDSGLKPDEEEPQNVGLVAAQLRFELTSSSDLVPDKKAVTSKFLAVIKENNMAGFYTDAVDAGIIKMDPSLMSSLDSANSKEFKQLEEKVKDAEENFGEIEVMEAKLNIALFQARTGTKEDALEAFKELAGLKSMSTGQKIDLQLKKILLGFMWMDTELAKTAIEEAERLLEDGGDWDRRNRLKVYRGLYAMVARNFIKASEDFLSAVATFTSSDLCPYEEFIFYTVMTSVLSLDRVEFKKQVIDSPEVLTIVRDIDHLKEFMDSLYECDYKAFFSTLIRLNGKICTDRYFAVHKDWFFREVRVLAYKQFLESYKSVTIKSMAKAFGVSIEFLDKELSHFISSSKINAKIDKVSGVIETSQPNETNQRYQSVIKQGDVLLNRVQLLSRAINV